MVDVVLSIRFIGALQFVTTATAPITSGLIGQSIQEFLAEIEWRIKAIREEIKQKGATRLVPP
jgi:hypothetical protein